MLGYRWLFPEYLLNGFTDAGGFILVDLAIGKDFFNDTGIQYKRIVVLVVCLSVFIHHIA